MLRGNNTFVRTFVLAVLPGLFLLSSHVRAQLLQLPGGASRGVNLFASDDKDKAPEKEEPKADKDKKDKEDKDKKDKEDKDKKDKEEKEKKPAYDEGLQVDAWRMALRVVRDQEVPLQRRVAIFESLLVVGVPQGKLGTSEKDAVAAGLALLQELERSPLGDAKATSVFMAKVITVLGVVGNYDADPVSTALIELLPARFYGHKEDFSPSPCAQRTAFYYWYLFGRDYRVAAAESLGHIKSTRAIPDLIDILLHDKYPMTTRSEEIILQAINADVRRAAAQALGEIGSDVGLSYLVIVAESDANTNVRDAARKAIRTLRKKGPEEKEALPQPMIEEKAPSKKGPEEKENLPLPKIEEKAPKEV